MDYALFDKYGIVMAGRARSFTYPALVDRHVDKDGSRPHRLEVLPLYELRSLCPARQEDSPDHKVGFFYRVGDGHRITVDRDTVRRHNICQVGQLPVIYVHYRNFGSKPGRDLGSIYPDSSPSDDEYVCGRNTRDSHGKEPASAVRPPHVIRSHQD